MPRPSAHFSKTKTWVPEGGGLAYIYISISISISISIHHFKIETMGFKGHNSLSNTTNWTSWSKTADPKPKTLNPSDRCANRRAVT